MFLYPNGTFAVEGGAASITLNNIEEQSTGGTISVSPTATGLSVINVVNDYQVKGALNVDLSNFDGSSTSLTVLNCGGNLSGAFSATNFVGNIWSADVVYDYGADEIRLENISGPPSGTVIVIK